MKGPRELRRAFDSRRSWAAKTKAKKNGKTGWFDDPWMEKLFYNSKKRYRRNKQQENTDG